MDCAMALAPRMASLCTRPACPPLYRAVPHSLVRHQQPRSCPETSSGPANTPRLAAMHFPQEWLGGGREDEWKAADKFVEAAESKSERISWHLAQTAHRAVSVGLRVTALAVHLAMRVVADMRRALWWQERQARAQQLLQLAAEKARREQEAAAAQKREQLRQRFKEAGDAGFVALLHTMDNPNIPLETKWSGIQQHLATKQEFGKHLSQLFTLAGESSRAVQGMATNPSAFWKSEHTRSVIAQEEALKRHVFLQMLHGSSAPA